ncbi:UNVERIFIED_CONTAM: hypothetical protein Sangu_3148200 [Sesamum angustifolium]|uniref:Uncharacterized protein n=1 Tax=Sesamum angustifolium TaxID=2727405 RepID=A0AAW2JZU3_9LAMI
MYCTQFNLSVRISSERFLECEYYSPKMVSKMSPAPDMPGLPLDAPSVLSLYQPSLWFPLMDNNCFLPLDSRLERDVEGINSEEVSLYMFRFH